MQVKNKPRLKSLDELFLLNDGVNPLEHSVPIIQTSAPVGRMIVYLAFGELSPFRKHPFRLYEGERLDDMVESIRKNGVLIPIIVRRLEGLLEILSGHNRVNAAELAGLAKVPAIILENVSDDDAQVYVVETNLIQRSFADMSHSEKAAVIALHHSKMFSQGKRNDILEQLKILESPHERKGNETYSQIANKLKSISKIGQEYGLSKDTIARYLRIHQLCPELKALLDNGNIGFIPAVTLSYLKEQEQSLLTECLNQPDCSLDIKKAELLRKLSDKGTLTSVAIHKVLSGAMKPKPNRTPTVKVAREVYTKYFTPSQSAKEVQGIVEAALAMYFAKRPNF